MAARTLPWPPKISNGRVAMTADPASPSGDRGQALRQVVRLRHSSGKSLNPWNEAEPLFGLESPAFAPQRATSSARTKLTSREHFAALEAARRARLVSIRVGDTDGRRDVVITYNDLEQDTREELEIGSG